MPCADGHGQIANEALHVDQLIRVWDRESMRCVHVFDIRGETGVGVWES